jgi:hypothetical protein
VARRGTTGDLIARLPSRARLAVPVLGAAGGVGASTVAALLAAQLHRMLPPPRALTVVDAAPAASSPWPESLSLVPPYGSSFLAPRPQIDLLAKATARAQVAEGSILVLTDTNPPPARGPLSLDLDPELFHPYFAAQIQALILDAGTGEGPRLSAREQGGGPSLIERWLRFGLAATGFVWVTSPHAASLRASIAAVTRAERIGLSPSRWVIAVPLLHSGAMPRRARADLTLLADRVAAICPIDHRSDLHSDPAALATALNAPAAPDIAALAAEVLRAAGVPTAPRTPPAAHPQSAPIARKVTT